MWGDRWKQWLEVNSGQVSSRQVMGLRAWTGFVYSFSLPSSLLFLIGLR